MGLGHHVNEIVWRHQRWPLKTNHAFSCFLGHFQVGVRSRSPRWGNLGTGLADGDCRPSSADRGKGQALFSGRQFPEWPPAQGRGAGLLEHRWGQWGQGMGRGFLSRHSLQCQGDNQSGLGCPSDSAGSDLYFDKDRQSHLNLSPLSDSGKKPWDPPTSSGQLSQGELLPAPPPSLTLGLSQEVSSCASDAPLSHSKGTQSSPAEVTACTPQLHSTSSRQLALIYYNPRVLRTILSKFLKYLVSYCSHFYVRMPIPCFYFLSFLLDSKISDGCNRSFISHYSKRSWGRLDAANSRAYKKHNRQWMNEESQV